MSTRSTTTFIVLLIILLGLAAGFWISGFWATPPADTPVPFPDATTGDGEPEGYVPVAGWCCMERGGACTENTSGAIDCLRNGGQLFNKSQSVCDSICQRLQQR